MTTSTIIQPGDKGADFVALTDRIKAWLIANQIRFVCRYVVPAGWTSIGKDYREWETAWYHEHGIAVLPNFERHHDDATRYPDDRVAGEAHGRTFLDLCKGFGFPADVPHFVSVDQDIWRDNIDQAEAYVRGFAGALEGRPLGIYGDDDIVYRVRDLEPIVWRPNASGWDGESRPTPVHVQQHLAIPTVPGGSKDVDPNTCRTAFRGWLPTGGTMSHAYRFDERRVLDTRANVGKLDTLPRDTPVGTGVYRVDVPGVEDGVGVEVTITAVGARSAGFLAPFKGPDDPGTSALNFAAGQTIANTRTVEISDSSFLLRVVGTTDVVVDLVGVHLP